MTHCNMPTWSRRDMADGEMPLDSDAVDGDTLCLEWLDEVDHGGSFSTLEILVINL